MYDKLENCPLCKSSNIKNSIICTDHFLSGESFAISQCQDCKLEFTNPRPKEELLPDYYKSPDYISHANKGNSIINKTYQLVRGYTLNTKVKLINSVYQNRGSILDFGCGTGEFLAACKKSDWNVSGIEPESKARVQAEFLIGQKILSNLKRIPADTQFNVITLWHVLEHIAGLNKFLKSIKKKLAEKGRIVIAVPNNQSWDALHYKEYWAAYDVPRHLYHFNQESIYNLCEKHGLKLLQTVPMKFDSYYISLLSEKYKSGRSNYIKSFINGSLSNIYAKKNQNNYSSLIYILKK